MLNIKWKICLLPNLNYAYLMHDHDTRYNLCLILRTRTLYYKKSLLYNLVAMEPFDVIKDSTPVSFTTLLL